MSNESTKALENSSAEKHWENFIALLIKEDTVIADKIKCGVSPFFEIDKFKDIFLRANSGE